MKDKPHAGAPSRADKWRQRGQRLRAHLRNLSMVGMGVVIALVALFIYGIVNPGPPRLTAADVANQVASAMASATPPPSTASLVYQAIQPSIVSVQTHFLNDQGNTVSGSGTGVVLDTQGDILTSLHLVKQALDTQVVFADGSKSGAILAASEVDKDIAVLRALQPPSQLVPATLGDPQQMHVGDEAVVVGNPFGLTDSLTAGTISGLGRNFMPPNGDKAMTGLIQFDAAINPGNSGGPLLNRNGEVVGIVTGLVNPTGQDVFIGIGFAVPIDVAASAAGTPPY